MPDIGLGEVAVIAVLALLVFGPDRLPKVAADAGRLLRQMRELATNARKDLIDAAGLQEDGELRAASAEIDPRRVLRDEPAQDPRTTPATAPVAAPAAAAAPTPAESSATEDWT